MNGQVESAGVPGAVGVEQTGGDRAFKGPRNLAAGVLAGDDEGERAVTIERLPL